MSAQQVSAAKAPTAPNKSVGECLHDLAHAVYAAGDLLVTAGCYSTQPILREQALTAQLRATANLRSILARLEVTA